MTTAELLQHVDVLNEKFKATPFRARTANIIRGENWTAGRLNMEYNAAVNGINDSPKYQRPDCVGFPQNGNGDTWQRNLIRDFLMGHPIQPLHFRSVKPDTNFKPRKANGEFEYANAASSRFAYEIVDGGHRTRTIVNFLRGNVRTPESTIIHSEEGDMVDVSELNITEIANAYPFLMDYINNLPLDVYEYHNLSDDAAEELFLKLNDLHDMSPADKRNAINNIIADTCRKYGAIDSRYAFSMFKETELDKTGKLRLRHAKLALSGRETDEMVSWTLYYLYKNGIRGKISVGSQAFLNTMYRDPHLIARLSDPNDKLMSQLLACLNIVNEIVTNHQLSIGKKGSKWGVHFLKKLMMFVAEAHYSRKANDFMFDTIKIDSTKFFKSLDAAIGALTKDKTVKHHPYQLYKVENNTVVPLPKDQQNDVNYGQTYSFLDVFKGGHRYDDLMFCYYHMLTKGLLTFGKKGSNPDERRFFTDKEAEELYKEQGGMCRRCNIPLTSRDEYQVDHIVPHDAGGITDVRNGQILCTSCNNKKSSGMHISDVQYACEKMQYQKTAALLEIIGEDVLSAESIRLVAKKLF